MTRHELYKIDTYTFNGLKKLFEYCPKKINKDYKCSCDTEASIKCFECIEKYLSKDVKTKRVKRFETYNGNLYDAYYDFTKYCDEHMEIVPTVHGFVQMMMEEIEVEVEE